MGTNIVNERSRRNSSKKGTSRAGSQASSKRSSVYSKRDSEYSKR